MPPAKKESTSSTFLHTPTLFNYFKRLLPGGSNQENKNPEPVKNSPIENATIPVVCHNSTVIPDPEANTPIKTTPLSEVPSRDLPTDHNLPLLPLETVPLVCDPNVEIPDASPMDLEPPPSTDPVACIEDDEEIPRHTSKRTRMTIEEEDDDDDFVMSTPQRSHRSPYIRTSTRKSTNSKLKEIPHDVFSPSHLGRRKDVPSAQKKQTLELEEDTYKVPLAFDEDEDSDNLPDADWMTDKTPTSVQSVSTPGLRRSSRRKTTTVLFANESHDEIKSSSKASLSLEETKSSKPLEDRDRSQFSLATLLNEKINRSKSGFDLEMLKSKDMFLVEGDDDDEASNYDRGNITNTLVAADQRDRITQLLNANDECVPDPTYPSFGEGPAILPIPSLQFGDCAGDGFSERLSTLSEDPTGLSVIFEGNWIDENQRRGWKMNVAVADWLFYIVAYLTDHGVVHDASGILRKALESKVDSPFAIPTWTFSYECLCDVFSAYGARNEFLGDGFQLKPLMRMTESRTVDKEKNSPIPIPNLRHLLQLLASSVQYRKDTYAKGELARIALLLLKVSLDVRVREVAWEIEVVITKCYEGMGQSEEDWEQEAKDLATRISKLANGVRAYECSILEKLPVHRDRDVWFRSRLAFLVLFPNATKCFGTDPIRYGDLHHLFTPNRAENVFRLEATTDYPHLSLTVQIMEFVLSDEKEMGKQRKDIVRLIEQMKSFHGKIVDSRAAFLNRTVLKDYLQRLYIRLHFQVCHDKTTDGVNRQRTLFQTGQFTRNVVVIDD